MTKRSALAAVLFFCTGLLFAGDVANFVNLGFSPDSRYFMFGQYGVTEGMVAYAGLYAVDVAHDQFVPNGEKSGRYLGSLEPGEDGRGELYNLIADNAALARRLHINHLLTGRVLYLLLDGQQPKPTLHFRDFQTGNDYTVALDQFQYSSSQVSSSFSIDVTIHTAKGKTLHFTVGLPNYKRIGVESYRIRRIVVGPNNRSLVFVIEKQEKDKDGVNVRYMVDTLALAP